MKALRPAGGRFSRGRLAYMRLRATAFCSAAAVFVGCAATLGITSAVAAESVTCPAAIRTSQQLAQNMSPWSAIQLGTSSRLLYAEIYDGPPRNEQIIMPDEHKEERGREVMTWRFRGQPAKEGTWLLCSYQNTQVKLELRLPETVTECSQTNSTDTRLVVKLIAQDCR